MTRPAHGPATPTLAELAARAAWVQRPAPVAPPAQLIPTWAYVAALCVLAPVVYLVALLAGSLS